MGSNDLADASVSGSSEKGKGVTERLKGLFGPKKKAQDMTTLDDVRFSEPSYLPETNREETERTYQRAESVNIGYRSSHIMLEDLSAEFREDDDLVDMMEIEEAPVFTIRGAGSAIEKPQTITEMEGDVDYCDFLPPMCRGERRPVGSRSYGNIRSEVSASDRIVYDLDEPVSGLRTGSIEIEDGEAEPEVQVTPAEMHYVPNFIIVEESQVSDVIILPAPKKDPEVTLEEMLPEEAVMAFEQEDSDVPFDLDIRIYDDDECAVPVQEAEVRSVSEQPTSGIDFDFFSLSESNNSGIRFEWGKAEEKEAAAEIAEKVQTPPSSRLDGMFI